MRGHVLAAGGQRERMGMTQDLAPPYAVRPAQESDVPALQQFLMPFVEVGRLLPRTYAELRELVPNGFVATCGQQIVGFAALEIYSTKLAEVRSLAVSPIHQGHGLGTGLVQACVERAKERRVFEVMAITSADEFFQRCGFDFTLPGEKKALFLQTRDAY
jgi:N-acetylglutamate synthase-like GNAT family acetyltransferase